MTQSGTQPETPLLGEMVYEGHFAVTSVVEYGASLQMVTTGAAPIPASGFRIDVGFEGPVTGRISGSLRGVDYLEIGPDGRITLHIHGELTTDDGAKIAVHIGGVGLPEPTGRTLIHEHVKLTTADPAHAWVNPLEIWGIGHVDLAAGTIDVAAYLPAQT